MLEISIGEAARRTGLSIDTLRYYEKIKLMPPIARDSGGRRHYGERDLAQLRFIQRAQRCNFSLVEIGELLKLRRAQEPPRPQVRQLTEQKLKDIKTRLEDLERLKHELELLLNLCCGSDKGCPIIESLDSTD
ncbi:MerR family transcriptional regulator [Saccharospirillum sp.]|uniref:MerR family transcriptional regulator n=1 Tax=Saccharospirillum sp. TaxID=2033801 RepID=UPI0034A00235